MTTTPRDSSTRSTRSASTRSASTKMSTLVKAALTQTRNVLKRPMRSYTRSAGKAPQSAAGNVEQSQAVFEANLKEAGLAWKLAPGRGSSVVATMQAVDVIMKAHRMHQEDAMDAFNALEHQLNQLLSMNSQQSAEITKLNLELQNVRKELSSERQYHLKATSSLSSKLEQAEKDKVSMKAKVADESIKRQQAETTIQRVTRTESALMQTLMSAEKLQQAQSMRESLLSTRSLRGSLHGSRSLKATCTVDACASMVSDVHSLSTGSTVHQSWLEEPSAVSHNDECTSHTDVPRVQFDDPESKLPSTHAQAPAKKHSAFKAFLSKLVCA